MSFGTILSAIGTGFTVASQVKQGQQQQQLSNFNAAVSKQKAQLTQQAGDLRIDRLRREKRRFAAKQTAAFAKAGVRLTGSPLQTIADSAAELEMDILIEDFNTRVGVMNAQSNSELDLLRGDIANRSGFIGAGKTLLTQIPNFITSQNRARI